MSRINHRILRIGMFVIFALLVCIGIPGSAGQSQAKPSAGLSLDLYPSSQETPYVCLGKPVRGWFIVNAGQNEPNLSNPQAPITPTQIQVSASSPLVGSLSKASWTINSSFGTKGFTYTPAKTGSEHLIFSAQMLNTAGPQVVKNIDFKVINCHYRITIHSEFHNLQGGITSNIFYDGDGTLDLVPNGTGSAWSIMGYGTTSLEEYVDGTEGDVTCVTTSPGKGAGSFWIEGSGDPSTKLKPVFHFTDIITSVGQTCTDKGKGKTMESGIPSTGWLPNSGAGGAVGDIDFSTQGGQKELDVSKVSDARWVEGSNTGSMSITIAPEASK